MWSAVPAERDIDPRIQRIKSTTSCGKRITRARSLRSKETVGCFPDLSRIELRHTIREHLRWQTSNGRNRLHLAMRVLEVFRRPHLQV